MHHKETKHILLSEEDLFYINEAVKKEQWVIVSQLIENLNEYFESNYKHTVGEGLEK